MGLGRSAMFSNLYGTEGVARMIYLLKTELSTSMKLMGESDVSAINSSYVSSTRRTFTVDGTDVLRRLTPNGWRTDISVSGLSHLSDKWLSIAILFSQASALKSLRRDLIEYNRVYCISDFRLFGISLEVT